MSINATAHTLMLNPEKYTGKSIKYLSIDFPSYKQKVQQYNRSAGWTLTIDEIYDIMTPSKKSEIPIDVVPQGLTDTDYRQTVGDAFQKFSSIANILYVEYWNDLTNILSRKSKWTAVELFASAMTSGRRGYVLYRHLIDLYIQITILRTAGDHTSSEIPYED